MRPKHGSYIASALLVVALTSISLVTQTEAQEIVTRPGEGLARIGGQAGISSEIPTFISATPLLEEGQRRLARLAELRGIAAGERLTGASAVYEVGEEKKFWAVDFTKSLSFPYEQYQVTAECRAVGDYAYYFIESDQILAVGADALSEFIAAFEETTPFSPRDVGKGIYEHVTEVFGDVPDVDSDQKIIILITDIPDEARASAGTSFFSGYFYSVNQ
ncbi:hypothetical protein ACFL6T_04380, partial [Candidatus Zixiibacteriota bacterium]